MSDPDIQPLSPCCACDALWLELTQATAKQLKLQLDVYMARANHDWDADGELNSRLQDAEVKREAARVALRLHEAAKHGQVS